ncbi:MAG: hypothetical protein ACRC5R_04310 [Mycoplasmatales bacterium]
MKYITYKKNIILFFIKVFFFKESNPGIIEIFDQQIKNGIKTIDDNLIIEGILSDYYCCINNLPKNYFYKKNGVEIYKNFIYYISSLNHEDYLEFSNKALNKAEKNDMKISKIPFLSKIQLFSILLLVVFVIIEIYIGFKLFPV